MAERRGPPIGEERGLALVIVLLVLSLLLTIAGEFALAMRLEGTTTLNFRASVASAYLAEAAYQRARVELGAEAIAHELDPQGQLVFRRSRTDPPKPVARQDIALGPGRFSYRITDEDSRLNLNSASREQLMRLLQELGVDRQAQDVIADSILDWKDANEEHRLNGAESDYYLALPVPYKSKNANFDSVEELLQVRGVTSEIFYGTQDVAPGKCRGLVDCLTVAGSGAINVNTASDTVLAALGYAQVQIDLLKQGRQGHPYFGTGANDLPPGVPRLGTLTHRSSSFRIEATGEVPGQGRRTLRVIVQRQSGRQGTTRMVAWGWVHEEDARR
jgi:type II secretory pathway component PulK